MVNNIKNILFFISNIIKTPALLYHESCHLIVCLLTFTKVSDITIHKSETFKKDFSYDFQIYTLANSYTKNLLISIAPLLGSLILIILCFYIQNFLLYSYLLFCSNVFLPSKEDYDSISEFKSDEDLVLEMLELTGEDFEADEFEFID